MITLLRKLLLASLILTVLLGACSAPPLPAPTEAPAQPAPSLTPSLPTAAPTQSVPIYLDESQPVEARVEDLLARMTLEEKVGQMTQVEKNSLDPLDVERFHIGSVLSGGGGAPPDNTAQDWAEMIDGFQEAALRDRLQIPILYGVDAVHGHNNLWGATIFPHNIGLGAADDPDLMRRIGRATAEEMLATGAVWNFAPVIAVPQDIRWGRTYEGYGEQTDLVTRLGTAYLEGMQNPNGALELDSPLAVLGTPKHFIGDGATIWGSSVNGSYQIDQGDMQLTEAEIREMLLPPYQAAVEAGAMSIMVSFSSWDGVKLHAQKALLTDLLKSELGFQGFLVSDWAAIDQLPGGYASDVSASINAGLDMIMVPYDYRLFIQTLTNAVNTGAVPMDRIDDAVRRILRVKFALGLFERPFSNEDLLGTVGSAAHRKLASEAVQKSLVLLKNDSETLPLSREAPLIFVAGSFADDIGAQCGGWTISWQGQTGDITLGSTILEGIRAQASAATRVEYQPQGKFEEVLDAEGQPAVADVGIVVIGERPYAEGEGDSPDLEISARDLEAISRVRERSHRLVVVLLSGRPLIVTPYLAVWDALVAAWLPGSEGAAVADGLFGESAFTGRLPYAWPRSAEQLPLDKKSTGSGCAAPLFPVGYGPGAENWNQFDLIVCPE